MRQNEVLRVEGWESRLRLPVLTEVVHALLGSFPPHARHAPRPQPASDRLPDRQLPGGKVSAQSLSICKYKIESPTTGTGREARVVGWVRRWCDRSACHARDNRREGAQRIERDATSRLRMFPEMSEGGHLALLSAGDS